MIKSLDSNHTYIVAVSGGPDSMALLSMLTNQKYKLIVCTVNYKTRDVSDYEVELVKQFCLINNHKFMSKVVDYYKEGNFQDFARVERYRFFKNIYDEYNAHGLLLAHHLDDALETYLMQKKRNSMVKNYGLVERSNFQNMVILRPLLDYTKLELLKYCDDNNIPYSIDVSNLQTKYTRNLIRKEILNKLTDEDKLELTKKMRIDQGELEKLNNEILIKMKDVLLNDKIDLMALNNLTLDEQVHILYLFLVDTILDDAKKLSKARMIDILNKANTKKGSIVLASFKEYQLNKQYQYLSLDKKIEEESYCYLLNQNQELITDYFEIQKTGEPKFEIFAASNDYPLTIRPYRLGDKISTKNGHKKVNRIFIDKKIPSNIRKIYPIIVSKSGEVLFIPKLYKDYHRKNLQTGQFMIELICYKKINP